jgi:hypothetical protein
MRFERSKRQILIYRSGLKTPQTIVVRQVNYWNFYSVISFADSVLTVVGSLQTLSISLSFSLKKYIIYSR